MEEVQPIPKNSPRAKDEDKLDVPGIMTLEHTWSDAFTMELGPLWHQDHAV